ncbi:hypothetical protein CDV31_014774 [Fusarium ambrosium]|uniref:Uncharacterized protein n=1 Tax=Fusarium ambrosium TaxID=131363 RepID=A0A428SUC6_9HYPO|nr:hypothetical protein CDV31_014774 [Fusarium ambrosium]
MRFSHVLPFLGSSALAAPAPSPLDDPAIAELARRAAITPGVTATTCSVKVKGENGFPNIQAADWQGTMYIVNGLPAPAGNKNGDNPFDVVLRAGSPDALGLPYKVANSQIGSLLFVINGFLTKFPQNLQGPSVDYVTTKVNGINYRADVDFSSGVDYTKQPQRFVTARKGDTTGLASSYPVSEGFLVMDVTVTGKDTRSINGGVQLYGPANVALGILNSIYTMRASLLLLPSLIASSIWASPTPSPFNDPALAEQLGRRAAAAGQPTITATQWLRHNYVKVKGTAANFQADVDGSNVPIAQQPQRFTTSMTNGPVTTYPITSGFLGMKISDPTAQNTRDVNGAFYFNGPNFALYVGFVTGSCLGSATLPLNLA